MHPLDPGSVDARKISATPLVNASSRCGYSGGMTRKRSVASFGARRS